MRWASNHSLVGVVAFLLASTGVAQAVCPCDCDGDGEVRVDEITTGVGIALGRILIEQCPRSDPEGDGSVSITDLIGGVDAVIHGCASTHQRAELERNRELWSHGERLPSHQYRLHRGCFCPPPNDLLVTVIDRDSVEIVDPDSGEPIDNLDAYFPVTIDDLFDLVDDAIDHADFVEVDYDPVWGAPIRIAIDYLQQAVDDEVSFLLSDLQPFQGNDCRDTSDCDNTGALCIEPGGFVGCGICDDRADECSVDEDCAADTLCRRQPKLSCGACDGEPILTCQEGCVSDAECRDGEVCGDDGHCSLARCLTSVDCNNYFDCSLPDDARTGICERRLCTADVDCNDGLCVNAQCYGSFGHCEIVPP
jgi:hypothetical protein